jgi:tetratricopeptide (TPR) repeat protein
MVDFNHPGDGDHDAGDEAPREPNPPGGGDRPDDDDAAAEVSPHVEVLLDDEEEDDVDLDDVDLDSPDLDDVEDEFAEFIDEEMGYADIDWDSLPQKQVDEHDRVRHLPKDELANLNLDKANDLIRWAAARAYLEHGDESRFERLAEALLASKKRSKALDYVDIALALMGRQARRNDFDAAFATLDRLSAVAGHEQGLAERFRGILTIQRGDRSAGLERLAELAETRPDDPDFLLSLGEDLCGIGMWEPALEYLEIAEELARAKSDTDLLASIENAAQFAQRHLAYDDLEDDA